MHKHTNQNQKIRAALKQAKGTHKCARVVAVNMVRIRGFGVLVAADALGVDRGTVGYWLDAYDRCGPDGLADDARPGRPYFVPRVELKIVGCAKRFTACEFGELVERRTGTKYSEPHARRLLRSLGFAVKKTLDIRRAPSSGEPETWQKDIEKEVEALENDGFTLVMSD